MKRDFKKWEKIKELQPQNKKKLLDCLSDNEILSCRCECRWLSNGLKL